MEYFILVEDWDGTPCWAYGSDEILHFPTREAAFAWQANDRRRSLAVALEVDHAAETLAVKVPEWLHLLMI